MIKRILPLFGAALLLLACGEDDGGTSPYRAVDAGTDPGVMDASSDTDSVTSDTNVGDTSDLGVPDVTPDSEPLPDTDGDTGDGMGWAEFYATYLEPAGCSGSYCHGGFSGGLTFSDATSAYEAMVGVANTEPLCDTSSRVVAGDATSSSLYLRLRPSAMDEVGCEPPKMPPGTDGLSEDAAAHLAAWINAGALPN